MADLFRIYQVAVKHPLNGLCVAYPSVRALDSQHAKELVLEWLNTAMTPSEKLSAEWIDQAVIDYYPIDDALAPGEVRLYPGYSSTGFSIMFPSLIENL